MKDWIIAPCVGVVLIAIGVAFIRSHLQAWRQEKNDSQLGDADRKHYYRKFRRRMQTSGMLIGLGVLIPLGDALLPLLKDAVLLSTLYWIAVLLLACWVILLGVGDLASTTGHSRRSLERIRRKQRELEQEVQRIRARNSNGHDSRE